MQHNYISKEINNPEIENWITEWEKRIKKQNIEFTEVSTKMNKVNPFYIPRNHLIEKVIYESVEYENFGPLNNILSLLEKPFKMNPDDKFYTSFPMPEERVYQTFLANIG